MTKKKRLIGIIFSLIIIAGIFIIHSVYSSDEMYFSIEALMHRNEPYFGYSIGNPNTGGNNAAIIWNIVKRSGKDTDDILPGNYYCLKADVGFEDTNANVRYDVFYDLKKDRGSLIAQNDLLNGLLADTSTIPTDSGSVGRYEALLALLDMLYLPGSSDESYKEELLNNVLKYAMNDMNKYGSYIDAMMAYPLTDDDITAVQQAAIWYFTNYGEQNGKFDKTDDTAWLCYTLQENGSYSPLTDYNRVNGEGTGRSFQAEALYNYLIEKAKAAAPNYIQTSNPTPVTLSTSTLNYEESGDNYILGPIHLDEKENNNLDYELQVNVSNESGNISDYRLLDSNKRDVTGTSKVKDLVGQDFYISIAKSKISGTESNINIDFNIDYEVTSTVVAAVNGHNDEQPIAMSEKQKLSSQENLNVTIEQKDFDLALRKYITKVNGTELAGENSRVPNVDESTLETGTTATYKHKKDPVLVKTGDTVTYKLTVYNEGEKVGRATEVIDQLPTGLEFKDVVSGNFEESSYDKVTNRLTLVRKSGNEENLPAYEEGNLSSETIEIECTVTLEAGANDKILTNVAWISKEVDGETGTEIITQEGLDRDSEPGSMPEVNKDNMEEYAGTSGNSDLSDKNYYYKGQQDDDDFEKLIIEKAKGYYSLQVVKVDKDNEATKLLGAEFKITLPDGSDRTETTGSDGTITIDGINIKEEGTDTIKVEELSAPTGYNKLFNSFELDVTKGIQSGAYVVTNIKLKNSQGSDLGEGKVKASYSNNLVTITVPNFKKNFDLALRKYITKVNGTELAGENSRVPNVDESTLETGTTATYKHKKDPVLVKTGDTVTYKLTVYNEGEKVGRATEVIDQLPTGLEFKDVVSGNFEESSYDKVTNRLTLVRKSGNEENLPAYEEGNLSSETIEIECTVTLEAGANDKVLTNVAWISKEVDGETGTEIITQEDLDRDSEPGSMPEVNKDNMEEYTGTSGNSDLSDKNYYYKGQQDDDDFEKLIIEKAEGSYSLQVVKVDKDDEATKLSGAEFKITLPDGSDRTETTGSDGIITIDGIDITEEGTDTIKVEELSAPTGYNKLFNSFELDVTKGIQSGAYVVTNIKLKNSQGSGLGEGEVKASYSNNLVTITVPNEKTEGSYSLQVVKVDKDDEATKLSGAEFKITLPDGSNRTETTDSNGTITIDGINITEEGTDTIKVEELSAPTGYNKLFNSFELDVTKGIQSGAYVVTNIKLKNSQGSGLGEGEVKASYSNNLVTITVPNEKTEGSYNLQVVKVDKDNENTKLSGAEFKITLPDGSDRTETTDLNGTITIDGIDITEEGTDTIKVEELSAPTGYNKLFNSFELDVTKGIQSGAYVVTNIELKNSQGSGLGEGQVKANYSNNLVTITVPNEKKEGTYSLQLEKVDSEDNSKKLQGAEFNVMLPEAEETELKTTNENGIVDLGAVEITDVGAKDKITIEEVTPPKGYELTSGEITIEVEKQDIGGSYSIKNASVTSGENVEVTFEGSTIKILVKNNRIKNFDLALRKYITKVNGTELAGENSRVPNVDESTLETGTTATYKHKKDPVLVKTGDTVTYKLTVYNEGEKVGRATEVIDQLPTGLEFKDVVSGNFEESSYDKVTNRLTLVRKSGNEENLPAYEEGNLSSETIEIECTVTLEAGAKDKVLTNVAWISKEVDGETGTEITTQKGLDRDSEPGSMPEVNKDNMEEYAGTSGNSDLSDKNYYYKGQQDDDDFEKLIIEKAKGYYSLQVVKVDKDNEATKLLGAEFKITLPDGSDRTETTGSDGTITIDGINITEEGTDTIKVEELSAPTGYNKLFNSFELDVTKGIQNGTYVVTNVEPKNIQGTEDTQVEYKDGVITVTVPNEKKEGTYSLQLEKVDSEDNSKKLQGAEFNVTLPGAESTELKTTGEDGIVNLGVVEITDVGTKDIITIKEVTPPTGYELTSSEITIEVEKQDVNGNYSIKNASVTSGENTDVTFDGNTVKIVVKNKRIKEFDLSLRKFIIAVSSDENIEDGEYLKNSDGSYTREPVVDTSLLNTADANGNMITTATYNHTKEPVTVKRNDYVVYMLRAYNEGEIAGYAAEIKDHLPEYLEFVDNDFNRNYGWSVSEDGRTVTTSHLENSLINAAEKTDNGYTLSYVDVPIMCKVIDSAVAGENITNIADITEYQDENRNPAKDRDSSENNVELPEDSELPNYKDDESGDYIPGQEDDDDFEKIVVEEDKSFDISLRKFIIAVSSDENIEDGEYLRNSNGSYTREPVVDTSLLNTADANGNMITTATYNHTKEPVTVKRNDYVVYMLRAYNEGEIAGYAAEIKDHLPEYLEFVDNDFNRNYGWSVSEDGRTVTTSHLENSLINAAEKTDNGYTLSYVDVPIMCKVIDSAVAGENITNIADITEYQDENRNPAKDRDSSEDNVELPEDSELPNYKDEETGDYIPGQEDDDDFEKVIVQEFDLALRKFITKVDNKDITNRIPKVSYDEETGKITYNHTKKPLEVVTNNVVTYTIRVYNEGEISGYASEITDDIPEGLEFLPDNETNINYRWVMYDEEGNVTENVDEAKTIKTDYLSKEQEESQGDNLLKAFNPDEEISDTNPAYKDVQVAFKVIEPNESDRILVNSAQISDDSDENGNEIDDKDSIPDEWNDGEDDQDKEYVKLVYFDLSLRKWVTQAIVTDKNGNTQITETGHQPYDDPEQIVKVDLYRKSINDVTVKFRYKIRVTNEGEIAGYAKEITDYVPEGLRFLSEDNPGWKDEGNNVISTRLLENTLLQPGEYAEVEVVLTWINSEDNMGLKVNTAEISEDYNDYGVPDRDSTPDNQVKGEDDIDDAPVLLSVSTGQVRVYFTLGFVILITIAGGVVLIKKFAL